MPIPWSACFLPNGNVEKNIKYLHPKTGIINQAIKAKNKAPMAHQKDKVITALPLTEVGIYSEYNVATFRIKKI